MPDSTIQQIKDKLDIVEVVSSYIKLQKTGINFRAPCPFHTEKKPSFFVSPTRQMFKCFGCGSGGSIFDFIMKIEGIEFGDALRLLAKRAGVELKTFRPELRTKRQRLYEICEIACCFFEKQLHKSSTGKLVKEYLLKRGLKEETIRKWRLGYAPDQWRALSDFLVGRGYKREEVVGAGLAIEPEKAQTPYDRFRGRIIFPVFDLNSQVTGFGGRVFGKNEETAKYLNTPNTLLYDKGKTLYGLNFGKVEIRKKDTCILSEGYTDVILSHQAGFANTVASSGTALTPFQLKILKRYTSNLLFAFDMDLAGGLATKRGIDLAQAQDFEVKIICMPKDTDPADIITQNPKKWKKAIKEAKEIMAFYFDSALSEFDKESPQGKKQIARLFLPAIKRIPNRIVQSLWAQKLANALKVSEEAILEELKKITKSQPSSLPAEAPPGAKATAPGVAVAPTEAKEKQRPALLEEKVLSLVLKDLKCSTFIHKDDLSCFSPVAGTILSVCKKVEESGKGTLQKELQKLEKKGEEFKTILAQCSFKAEIEQDDNPEEEVQICLNYLKKISNQDKLQEISKEIQLAEEKGEEKKVKDLMQQFNQLAQLNKTA